MNTPTPNHKLGQTMQQLQESGKKPCYRIGGLYITIAAPDSVNPNCLYMKDNNWNYIGKITTDGSLKISPNSRIDPIQKFLVMEALEEPEKMAMSYGKTTGTCCCCGRKLTNKLSVELGIGPICRGDWFPDVSGKLDLGINTKLDIMEDITKSIGNNIGEELTDTEANFRSALGMSPTLEKTIVNKLNSLDLDPLLSSIPSIYKIDTVITDLAILYLALEDQQQDIFLLLVSDIKEKDSNENN